ncbi:BAK_1a_G0042490.mRNA.1.CDS.1 [Saccharomyces cerevisiae]|nr:BAK_1a_G0042490.mRNA.1.CDS.1 [Saccharomyces cerevisiae]CAI7283162.1 BAK_1a_G0042490.mRNA.1.CDS.1 [Saccharomyces cerevisiae]
MTTDVQFSSQEIELFRVKEFLIANNPAKINNENKDAVLTQIEHDFRYLIQYIKDGLPNLNESTRLIFPDTFSICLLRSHQIIASKKIDSQEFLSAVKEQLLTEENANIIFEYVLDFWADGGAPLMNALRDLFSKLLNLLKITYPMSTLKDVLFNWMNEILEVPSTLRVQYYLIDALSSDFDLYYIIEKKPHFIDNSFSLMNSDLLANSVGKCIVSLLLNIYEKHFKKNESFVQEWIQLWKSCALKYIHDKQYTKSINLYIMIPLFKNMPNSAFTLFLECMSNKDPSLLLSLLKIGQELGIEEEPFCDNKYTTVDSVNKLIEQDEYKLQVFEILTFSTKKSKPIRPFVFKTIKQYLYVFFVDTELERRNYFCSSMKHFIFRTRDCAYSLARDARKLKKAEKFPDEQREKLAQVEEARAFLVWLCNFIKYNLAPGTLYQANVTSLKLMHILIKSGVDKSTPQKFLDNQNKREYPFSIPILQDVTFLRLLIDLLVSNYADVRELSKEMLFIMISADESRGLFLDTLDVNALKWTATSLLSDYEKGDAGATVYEFIFTVMGSQRSFIDQTIDILAQMVQNLQNDSIGCAENSIGPHFAALSLILNKFNSEENHQDTSKIISKLINLVLKSWEATRNVVCHDSAHGILPEKYANCGVPDQVIISHAFRAIKEASYLLETILKKYPLTRDQLDSIGDLFIVQLSTIRHSGAFQAVLPGLKAFCIRCQLEFPAILEELLSKSVKSLKSKTQHITRRSGGLPFLVTTVLSAEVTKGRPLLQKTFENLLLVARLPIPPHQDEFDLPQVNAINCINAIFVEPKLSVHCTSFVSEALELALLNFDCDIWALRNCSIMLFTSLQNRIFGKVGRSVSAKLFFTKYSGLRQLLLNILNSSIAQYSGSERKSYQIESIFLVLNVLLRLRPTAGYTGLKEFNVSVYECLSNENWKIRDMASRVLHMLSENFEEEIRKLLDLASIAKQNQLHGHLLALQQLVPQYLSGTRDMELIQRILEKKRMLLLENKCFITKKAYLKLTCCILETCDIPDSILKDYISTLRNTFIAENNEYVVDGSKQLYLAQILDMLLKYEDSIYLDDICLLGLYSPFYEVQLSTLQYMNTNFHWETTRNSEFLEQLQLLLRVPGLLPMAKALVVKILSRKKNTLSLTTCTDLLKTNNSEDTKLAAVSSLSAKLSSQTFHQVWNLLQGFFADSCSKDFRLASLECLTAYPESCKNFRILLQLYNFLWDDDSEIREKASFYLNKNFIQTADWEYNRNTSVTALIFTKKFVDVFTSSEVVEELCLQLFQYLNEYDMFAAEESAKNCLFTIEKDNQFINELQKAMHILNMIKLTGRDISKCYKDQIHHLKSALLEHFNSEDFKDSPLGWCSNAEIFSRITLLKELIQHYSPSDYENFINVLTKHSVHPLIISYSQL